MEGLLTIPYAYLAETIGGYDFWDGCGSSPIAIEAGARGEPRDSGPASSAGLQRMAIVLILQVVARCRHEAALPADALSLMPPVATGGRPPRIQPLINTEPARSLCDPGTTRPRRDGVDSGEPGHRAGRWQGQRVILAVEIESDADRGRRSPRGRDAHVAGAREYRKPGVGFDEIAAVLRNAPAARRQKAHSRAPLDSPSALSPVHCHAAPFAPRRSAPRSWFPTGPGPMEASRFSAAAR